MNETARVCALERVAERVDYYSQGGLPVEYMRERDGAYLWEGQYLALSALRMFGGVLAQLGCGDGKGLCAMLAASAVNAKRPLILVPSDLRHEFDKEYAKFLARGFTLPTNLTVESHTFLSNKRRSYWLQEFDPDLVWIDEVSAFKHATTARSRRLWRFFEGDPIKGIPAKPTIANGGSIYFGAAAGTTIGASLIEMGPVARHTLGPRSPIPHSYNKGIISPELAAWANVVDPHSTPQYTDRHAIEPLVRAFCVPGAWRVLLDGSNSQARKAGREALKKRRVTCPGVIVTEGEHCKSSLVIHTIAGLQTPTIVKDAFTRLLADGELPNGDILETEIDTWRAGQNLSIGCYSYWEWPDGVRDEQWLWIRKRWHSAVRQELKENAHTGYDSEGNVWDRVRDDYHKGTNELAYMHDAFVAWEAMRTRYDPIAMQRYAWLSDYFVRDLVALAKSFAYPVIIWYASTALEWALERFGIPCYGDGTEPPDRSITCGLSLNVHARGKNLQDRWHTSVYGEFPSSGEWAEQSLARTHRPGQPAEVVNAYLYTHTDPFARNLASAMEKARLLEAAQGRQRLLYASIINHKRNK